MDGPDPELAAALAALDALRFTPRSRSPGVLWSRMKGAADFVGHNFRASERIFVRMNPYPRPFRLAAVPTSDGGALAAWVGASRPGAPGLVLTPGTFHTKDDTARKRKAIRVWREWGWNVLSMDLRGFGGSAELLGSGGLLESRDVLDAARWLRESTGCGPVAVLGESLGGAAAIVAASQPGAERDLDAVAAWSPFADLGEVVRHLTSDEPARDVTLATVRRMYRLMVWARSRGRLQGFDDFLDVRAETLGMRFEDLVEAASPVRRVAHVRVPTLVVHAEDDPVVPVRHARMLADAALGNPRVAVRVLPAGGHLRFDELDGRWYWGALDVFLRRVTEGSATRRGAA